MTIVPVSVVSPSDLRHLGNNLLPAVRRESHVQAVNRALDIFDEGIDRLYRRSRPPQSPRTRRRRRAA